MKTNKSNIRIQNSIKIAARTVAALKGMNIENADSVALAEKNLASAKAMMAGDGKVRHPALDRVWVMNLYPDGQCTGQLCPTADHARNHSTYTGEVPDAEQVNVRICTVKEWDALIESLNVKT